MVGSVTGRVPSFYLRTASWQMTTQRSLTLDFIHCFVYGVNSIVSINVTWHYENIVCYLLL